MVNVTELFQWLLAPAAYVLGLASDGVLAALQAAGGFFGQTWTAVVGAMVVSLIVYRHPTLLEDSVWAAGERLRALRWRRPRLPRHPKAPAQVDEYGDSGVFDASVFVLMLMFCGCSILASLFVSYTSLRYVFEVIGGLPPDISWAAPFSVDATIGAGVMGEWWLIGRRHRHAWPFIFALTLGLVFAVVTVAGNAAHGALNLATAQPITLYLGGQVAYMPWWFSIVASAIPGLALFGSTYATTLVIGVWRSEQAARRRMYVQSQRVTQTQNTPQSTPNTPPSPPPAAPPKPRRAPAPRGGKATTDFDVVLGAVQRGLAEGKTFTKGQPNSMTGAWLASQPGIAFATDQSGRNWLDRIEKYLAENGQRKEEAA